MIRATVYGALIVVIYVTLCPKCYKEIPWGVRWALHNSDTFELLSIKPSGPSSDPDAIRADPREKVEGTDIVLGSVIITDPVVRRELIAALDDGLNNGEHGWKCFDPRHAIRVRRGTNTYTILICFECGWVRIEQPDNSDWKLIPFRGKKNLFDKTLREAGIEQDQPPGAGK